MKENDNESVVMGCFIICGIILASLIPIGIAAVLFGIAYRLIVGW